MRFEMAANEVTFCEGLHQGPAGDPLTGALACGREHPGELPRPIDERCAVQRSVDTVWTVYRWAC